MNITESEDDFWSPYLYWSNTYVDDQPTFTDETARYETLANTQTANIVMLLDFCMATGECFARRGIEGRQVSIGTQAKMFSAATTNLFTRLGRQTNGKSYTGDTKKTQTSFPPIKECRQLMPLGLSKSTGIKGRFRLLKPEAVNAILYNWASLYAAEDKPKPWADIFFPDSFTFRPLWSGNLKATEAARPSPQSAEGAHEQLQLERRRLSGKQAPPAAPTHATRARSTDPPATSSRSPNSVMSRSTSSPASSPPTGLRITKEAPRHKLNHNVLKQMTTFTPDEKTHLAQIKNTFLRKREEQRIFHNRAADQNQELHYFSDPFPDYETTSLTCSRCKEKVELATKLGICWSIKARHRCPGRPLDPQWQGRLDTYNVQMGRRLTMLNRQLIHHNKGAARQPLHLFQELSRGDMQTLRCRRPGCYLNSEPSTIDQFDTVAGTACAGTSLSEEEGGRSSSAYPAASSTSGTGSSSRGR